MKLYAETHAICLHERGNALLEHYNKLILNNEMTPHEWRSILYEYLVEREVDVPDSATSSWELIDYASLDFQIELLEKRGIYCIKEIFLILWGVTLVISYFFVPRQKHLKKLFFATELICYAEASLSTNLFKTEAIQNRFTLAKISKRRVRESSEKVKMMVEDWKKQEESMTGIAKELWEIHKEIKAISCERVESYFIDQANFLKYWRKIPLYDEVVECFLENKEVKNFCHWFLTEKNGDVSLEEFYSAYQDLKKKFSINGFATSTEVSNIVTKFYPEEACNKEKRRTTVSLVAPTEELIHLLPDYIKFAEEDNIPLKDIFMHHIKNGALYDLGAKKQKDKKIYESIERRLIQEVSKENPDILSALSANIFPTIRKLGSPSKKGDKK